MSGISPVEQLRAALARAAQRQPGDRFDDMVKRGAIDASGKVLLRGPSASNDFGVFPDIKEN